MSPIPVADIVYLVKLWIVERPIRKAHTALRAARNRRRMRRGLPLLPPLEEDDMKLFPNGTMTYTGAGGAVATQIVTQLLLAGGIGECTPVELAANPGCQGAAQIAGALITAGFAVVAMIGRYRAAKSHAADIAALTAGT